MNMYSKDVNKKGLRFMTLNILYVITNRIGSLIFIDDETANRGSRMISEVLRITLSALILSNAAKLIREEIVLQMDNDPKHMVNAAQELLKADKLNVLR